MKKLLLMLLLVLSLDCISNIPQDTLKFKDSMISFFKSDLTNNSLDSYIDENTIIDIKGDQYFILDVYEFKNIFQVIPKVNKWLFIDGTKYHKAIGYYNNGYKLIFTFELDINGKIDTLHIY